MVGFKEIKVSFNTSSSKRVIIQAQLSLFSKSHHMWKGLYIYILTITKNVTNKKTLLSLSTYSH